MHVKNERGETCGERRGGGEKVKKGGIFHRWMRQWRERVISQGRLDGRSVILEQGHVVARRGYDEV